MRVNQEDLLEALPLHDRESDLTLVADLRLDNREELASIFGVATDELQTVPDSALVMRAYKKWGAECAQYLLGDFAFAVWDGKAQKLVLARDHMGQRYVHYHHAKDFFVFATDIKALWSYPDVPHALSEQQIGRIFLRSRDRRDARTLFEQISGLKAATIMTVGADGSIDKRHYWEPQADPVHERRDEAYYIAAYRRILGEAVACRIRRTIRSPGILFSGGYDSAAIAGLAGAALARSHRKLIAAASVMPADYRGNIRHARQWVELCARDMPHLDVHYVTREGKTVLSGLEQTFAQSGLPAGTYQFVTSELLSTVARCGAQVVMDGHGGDYSLNPRGQAALARFLATFQVRRFFVELRGHLRHSDHSLWRTLTADVGARLLPRFLWTLWRRTRRGAAPPWGDQPINPAFAHRLIAEGIVDEKSLRVRGKPRLDMREQSISLLRRLMSGPAPGAATISALHGLELTRPFHDKRVIELALAIPQDLYVKNGRNRYLACAALKDVYPREFQTRWRKNDDEIPNFQRMVKSIEPRLLADIARMEKSEELTRLIDFAKIRRLLSVRGPDEHNSGWEQDTQLAVRGYLVARYIEWFGRRNR